jgi:hypothetical protein
MDESSVRNRRRSERVVLKVPVTVLVETSNGKRAHEQAHTMVVNAHGGLLRSTIGLVAGQAIILLHPRTDTEQACRVVRVEDLSSGSFAVAFEFERPAPHFWPVVFPPVDWESVKV